MSKVTCTLPCTSVDLRVQFLLPFLSILELLINTSLINEIVGMHWPFKQIDVKLPVTNYMSISIFLVLYN